MAGIVAFEGELNAIVREYLEFNTFKETLRMFDKECSERGKTVSSQEQRALGNQELHQMQSTIFKSFDDGRRDEFLQAWKAYVPDKVMREDDTASKLEFYLQMYFAVYAIKYKGNTENMFAFQQYLSNEGAEISSTQDFLPFFALPYAPNPQQHPKFKELFQETWISELRNRLQNFVSLLMQDQPKPRLFELYHGGSSSRQMEVYKQRTLESQKQYANLMKKTNHLQNNYRSLVMIAADLVDSLEHVIQGGEISEQQVASLAQRLVGNATASNSAGAGYDLRRPGTAGELLRDSVRPGTSARQPAPVHQPQVQEVDYPRIKSDITAENERLAALLLQALRWELTKTAPDKRDSTLQDYVKADLLGCSHPSPFRQRVLRLLEANEVLLQETFSRLLNALASLRLGRNYLINNTDLVKCLGSYLQQQDQDSAARQNIIGCTQKLSLRRHPQTVMIEEGLIPWIVTALEDTESLSDYSLEYCVALLMNLCLRTEGKKQCRSIKSQILKVLADLLGHENQEIYPYVNGSLYSILAVPEVREEARAMGMEDMVNCCKRDDQPDINKQLDYIIKQISSEDPLVEESDDEDDEDAEEDTLDGEIDDRDQLVPKGPELAGTRLLQTYMTFTGSGSAGPASARRKKTSDVNILTEDVLRRPVTPANLRGDGGATTRPLSRPESVHSRASNRSVINNRPPTRSGSKAKGTPDPSVLPSKKVMEANNMNNEEIKAYQTAFTAKPKIPRTPARPTSQGSVGAGPTPRPEFSESLPQSRPGSGGRPTSNGSKRNAPSKPTSRGKAK